MLRVASTVRSRNMDENGNYDLSPIKSFERGVAVSEEPHRENHIDDSSTVSQATSAESVKKAMAYPEVDVKDRKGLICGIGLANQIYVFFMLYSSMPLLILSTERSDARFLGCVRVLLGVTAAILQLWPASRKGLPLPIKFFCIAVAFGLVGTLIVGKNVGSTPDMTSSRISQQALVHTLATFISLVSLDYETFRKGRLVILCCFVGLNIKSTFIDQDQLVPHFGRVVILAIAVATSSYECVAMR